MSYTASVVTLESDNSFQVASNQGYNDFCDWIDEIDWKEFEALARVRHYGWNEPASVVASELYRAVKSDPPKPSVKKTIGSLLKFIKSNDPDGVLVISQ